MKDILFNLALIDTTQFCKQHNIDCSGSHLEKVPRHHSYRLIQTATGNLLVQVDFHKSSVPTHVFNPF